MKKALIAMSGGVDSSVAALLTKEAGFSCIGCTMKLYDLPEDTSCERSCCSLRDTEDARSVAYRLGMPYYVFNFKDEFYREVIDTFIRSYENGKTPNPCIDCNRFLKFGKLFDRARILDCDKVVTGHYARIERHNDVYYLKKALDPTKDQSYVLYAMTQQQLAHTLFPLGTLRKTEVREIAAAHGFATADKAESQDICFVPDGDYARAIEAYTGKRYPPGPFLSVDGRPMGTHKGLIRYTVGQRKGLGISSPEPLYVCRICPENNTVYLGGREALFARRVRVQHMNWIAGTAPTAPFRCHVKLRYRQREQAATVDPLDGETVSILFDEPQRAPTPGQAAVLYQDDTVLGGGEITGARN